MVGLLQVAFRSVAPALLLCAPALAQSLAAMRPLGGLILASQSNVQGQRIEFDNTWAQWHSRAEYTLAVWDDAATLNVPSAASREHAYVATFGFSAQNARWIQTTQTTVNSTDRGAICESSFSRSAR